MGFLLHPSSLDTQMQAFKIPPFGYVSKRTRTARPRLKRFIQFFSCDSHLYKILGLLPPGFRLRSCPLDLLGFLYMRITAISIFSYFDSIVKQSSLHLKVPRPHPTHKWSGLCFLFCKVQPRFSKYVSIFFIHCDRLQYRTTLISRHH